jgi:hypothetical protein
VALQWRGEAKPGDILRASRIRHLDGAPYRPGDLLDCNTCGARVLRVLVTQYGRLTATTTGGTNQ